MEVTAALVTRGDVDLAPCIAPILAAGITNVVVWDNSKGHNAQVFGRYLAALDAEHEVVYTQDDDAVCPVADVLAAYQDDELMVNVDADEDWPWLSWGAVFKRSAILPAFARAITLPVADVRRWADVIFAELTPHRRVHLGHQNLEWAYAPNRMYHQPDHYVTQHAVRAKCQSLLA